MADEQVFLSHGNVLVSSSRIEINGQTFATRNVGSVQLTAPGMSGGGLLLAILGVVAAFGGARLVGLAVAAMGAWWAWDSSRRRRLMLVAGGGQVMALETKDGKLAETLRSAIAQAISVR